jgi:hypothetical protein
MVLQRDINPDRLIDKFKGKEGLFENSPLMKGQDKFNPNENTFRDFN